MIMLQQQEALAQLQDDDSALAKLSARLEALGASSGASGGGAQAGARRVPACADGRVVDASPAPSGYGALASSSTGPEATLGARTLSEQVARQEGRLRDAELRLQRLDATFGGGAGVDGAAAGASGGAAAVPAASDAAAHDPRVVAAVPPGSFGEVWRGLAEYQREKPPLELTRKWAAQNLSELRRAEAQLGGDSPPVVMGKWMPVVEAPLEKAGELPS